MGEVRVLIDIPAKDLEDIEAVARVEHRDRKKQLEWIILDWLRKNPPR